MWKLNKIKDTLIRENIKVTADFYENLPGEAEGYVSFIDFFYGLLKNCVFYFLLSMAVWGWLLFFYYTWVFIYRVFFWGVLSMFSYKLITVITVVFIIFLCSLFMWIYEHKYYSYNDFLNKN